MSKVTTGATMSLDGFIAGPNHTDGFDHLFAWYNAGDVEVPASRTRSPKAREIAGEKDVGVNGGEIARQCFDAGLLDEVHVDLVPVFLGAGIPLLGQIKDAPVTLEGPIFVTQGTGVTHLGYRVRR